MSYEVIGNANKGYSVRQEVIAWIRSEAGQTALNNAAAKAKQELQKLHEDRRLSHKDLYAPVTI